MVTLERDTLIFRFPEIHEAAILRVSFNRTLRVPDDDIEYPLPAGLGHFSVRHVEDFKRKLPKKWLQRGGVLIPMYQAEAMWIDFESQYPMAIKIAAGKINAVTGERWKNNLNTDPQDYVTSPRQPWIDGFYTGEGQVSQFVASRLGDGKTAEEQLTDDGEFGGLQIIAYPLKSNIYKKEQAEKLRVRKHEFNRQSVVYSKAFSAESMGLGLGGKIRQTIYNDNRGIGAWEDSFSRCFIHIINSKQWNDITGNPLPHPPVTQEQYENAKIPWFDYYDNEAESLQGSTILSKLKTFSQYNKSRKNTDKSIKISNTEKIRNNSRVSEGDF